MEPTLRHVSSNGSAPGQDNTQCLSDCELRDGPSQIRTISNIFYPTILVIGFFGNLMVIMVILKLKDMRSSTNIFLANLAIADLMVLLVWGTVQLVEVNSEWGVMAYSEKLCNIIFFIMKAMPSASVLTIVAISFERYYAICKPFKAKYICSKNRAFRICLLTWPVAALFASPHLFIGYQNVQYNKEIFIKTICEKPSDSFWTDVYYVSSASVFALLPVAILTVFHLVIARHLKEPAEPDVTIAAMKHRRHVVRLLITVIIAFFVCHVPMTLYSLLYLFGSTDMVRRMGMGLYKSVSLVAILLLYLHPLVNPILYSLMSKRFRAAVKSVFCDIRWKKSRRSGKDSTRNTTPEISFSSGLEYIEINEL